MTQQPPPYNEVLHNGCLALSGLAALAMALPPRKLDVRFLFLSGVLSLSSNQLIKDWTGHSMYGRFGERVASVVDTGLSEKAKQTSEQLRQEKAARVEMAAGVEMAARARAEMDTRRRLVGAEEEQQQQQQLQQKKQQQGWIRRLWMGDEPDDWKEKRAEEARQALEEGKGISDLISEHIQSAFVKKDSNEPGKKSGGDG